MHSTPLIQVERVFLGKLFIIPALEYSQISDAEMGFGPGYLARLWPFTVRQHILTLKSYQEFPEKFFAKTETQSSSSLKDADHIKFFGDNTIQSPFLKGAVVSVTAHGGNWLEFPKVFAAGADSRWIHLFWRFVLRSLIL